MPARVAIVACMRKLLTILNAILRDKKPWATAWPNTTVARGHESDPRDAAYVTGRTVPSRRRRGSFARKPPADGRDTDKLDKAAACLDALANAVSITA